MSKKNSSEEGILLINTPIIELVDYPTITNQRKGFYELTIADHIRIKGAGSKELIRNLDDIYFTIESINHLAFQMIVSPLANELLDLMKHCVSKDRNPDYNIVTDNIGIFGYNFCEPTTKDSNCSVKFTLWLGNPNSDKYVSYTVRMKWIGITSDDISAAVNRALDLIQSFFVDTRSIVRSVKRNIEVYFMLRPVGVPVFGIDCAGGVCPGFPITPVPPRALQSPDAPEEPEDGDDDE